VPRRIHIIGGPGSGKTYAAQHLSRRLGVRAYNLDDLFWDRSRDTYGVRASETDRDASLMAIVQESGWIIEGAYYSWVEPSFQRADFIFVLRPHVYLRDYRILARFIRRKLGTLQTKRETLRDLYRLLVWNHGYDLDNLEKAMECIGAFQNKITVYNSADDIVKRFVLNAPFQEPGKVR